ncbi:hypothetical protein GO491_00270 [Flavobacteriaceae bacterium Ap0902]|nr:hypothetical protein [Flavobacteriaceae bacterium Ap0902]
MRITFTLLSAFCAILIQAQTVQDAQKKIDKVYDNLNTSPYLLQTEQFKIDHLHSNPKKALLNIQNPARTEQNIFTPLENKPGDYWYSSMDWADYDQDGDLDLLISGAHPREGAPYDAGASTTHVYDNDGNGNLSLNTDIILQGVHASDVHWLDFDYDGDLDIVMMGIDYDTAFNMSALYENNNGTFTAIEVGTNGASWGGISIGDYDNDGDLDMLMTGWNVDDIDNGYASTFLWENNDGTFVRNNISAQVPGVFNGNIAWVDIDNDMDLDIVVSPAYGVDVQNLRIYKRENDIYTLTQKVNNSSSYAMFALGDYNNDGFVDIAVQTTDDDYNNFVDILKNNQGDFEYVESLPSVSSNGAVTPLAFGDYDNDGDLDLAVAGLDSDYIGVSLLYQNSDNQFTIVNDTGFDKVGGHSLSWADIDGDLDLDILITGFIDDEDIGEFYGTSRLYKNDIGSANTAPNPPTTLSTQRDNGSVVFNWADASDEQTPTEGLQYQLQVGKSPGGSDIANYSINNTSWVLNNLSPETTYYWCVKSIDTSFVKSQCSEEQMISNLSTEEVNLDKNVVRLVSNPVENGIIHLVTSEWGHPEMQVKLYDMKGGLILNKTFNDIRNIIDIPVHHLSTGKYILQYQNQTDTGALPIIIKQ